MPHSRTDTAQDDIALAVLSGCQYKVLRALVNRADERGICYPGVDYLAAATGYNRRHVTRALDVIEGHAVILYQRRDEIDQYTRRQLSNVMQINPDYISLSADAEPEAREMWRALIEKCGNDSARLWSHTITNVSNQAPKPTPVDQRQLTSTTNQRHRTPSASKSEGQGQPTGANPIGTGKAKNKKPAAKTDQRVAHPRDKSSVPPAGTERAQYANPDSINSNLPDAAHEGLASEIRVFGISMGLARGFVVTYGYKRTKTAFDQVKKMGDKAREPAAVFRSIVQVRLADDFAAAQQQIFGNRKQS